MDTAVIITLIIVCGIVLISLVAIAWLWSLTARGVSGIRGLGSINRQKELEDEVKELRREVDDLKKRIS